VGKVRGQHAVLEEGVVEVKVWEPIELWVQSTAVSFYNRKVGKSLEQKH
jgi:hypothetical protein